ncbi:uncharacterized protein LOC103709362 [Phoenix dactylifera]|uniref:Uncharacterized protein LOC103709362 n=1 Tax=Phoenix dactylifera TaxID=42345 RepID=A0A8B7C6M4_PHODC|nr:uncharacterized protein LOC103709362 [Phoenix dactylifera]
MGTRPTRCPPPPSRTTTSGCAHTAAECAAASCVLCLCCPLSVLWCCVKLPLKLAFQAARRLSHSSACCRGGGGGGGPGHRLASSSSSFSDIDFDADQPLPERRSGCPRVNLSSRRRRNSSSKS